VGHEKTASPLYAAKKPRKSYADMGKNPTFAEAVREQYIVPVTLDKPPKSEFFRAHTEPVFWSVPLAIFKDPRGFQYAVTDDEALALMRAKRLSVSFQYFIPVVTMDTKYYLWGFAAIPAESSQTSRLTFAGKKREEGAWKKWAISARNILTIAQKEWIRYTSTDERGHRLAQYEPIRPETASEFEAVEPIWPASFTDPTDWIYACFDGGLLIDSVEHEVVQRIAGRRAV
jgi:hypothetical protein